MERGKLDNIKGKGITDEDRLVGCKRDNMKLLLSVIDEKSVQNICGKMQCYGNDFLLKNCVGMIYHAYRYDSGHKCERGNECEIIGSYRQPTLSDLAPTNVTTVPRENRKKQLAICDEVAANTIEMYILHVDNYGWYMRGRLFEEYSLLSHADIQDNIL